MESKILKKKPFILVFILIIVLSFAIIAFLSFNRAGGEIGFEAIVLEANGNIITAEVISDNASFFAKKLPKTIVFDAGISGENNFRVGDRIVGDYLRGTIDGKNVRVVCFEVKPLPTT